MLNMYFYCSKLIINMAVSINGCIRIDVSDGKYCRLDGQTYSQPTVLQHQWRATSVYEPYAENREIPRVTQRV